MSALLWRHISNTIQTKCVWFYILCEKLDADPSVWGLIFYWPSFHLLSPISLRVLISLMKENKIKTSYHIDILCLRENWFMRYFVTGALEAWQKRPKMFLLKINGGGFFYSVHSMSIKNIICMYVCMFCSIHNHSCSELAITFTDGSPLVKVDNFK